METNGVLIFTLLYFTKSKTSRMDYGVDQNYVGVGKFFKHKSKVIVNLLLQFDSFLNYR